MDKDVKISITLDKRRILKNGKFPVRLRVFNSNPRKQKLFPTKFELTEKEFNRIWKSAKVPTSLKPTKLLLQKLENHAYDTLAKLDYFTFEKFETALKGVRTNSKDLFSYYDRIINKYSKQERLSTAETYKNALSSFTAFLSFYLKKKNTTSYSLLNINKEWLEEYESWMNNNNKSYTTVAIYLRTLRSVFNTAIKQDKNIPVEAYPFQSSINDGNFKIKKVASKKIALTEDELKHFYEAETINEYEDKAKDFWFLSYFMNGCNMMDIAHLRFNQLDKEKIEFVRQKND